MSFWAWMVFSVKGEKGTGMNALSWAAVWIWLPLLRAATSLLVPTSSPTGLRARDQALDLLLGLIRHLPEVVLVLRHVAILRFEVVAARGSDGPARRAFSRVSAATLAGGVPRSPSRARSAAQSSWSFACSAMPAVEEGLPLAAHLLQRSPRAGGRGQKPRSASRTPGQGSPITIRNSSS